MIDRSRLLAILAIPAGVVAYLAATAVIGGLPLPSGLMGLVLAVGPLFIAGLCMAALLLPTFDRMAKRDLAAHRAREAGDDAHGATDDRPGDR